MEKYFFMRPFLDLLAQNWFFCRAVSVMIKVSAALIVLFSFTTFFQAGKFTFGLPPNRILGGVLFEIFFVVAVYAVVHVLLIRARDIDRLAETKYYALSMVTVLIKMAGEAYAGFVGLIGVGGGLFVWFTASKLERVLNPVVHSLFPAVHDDPSFMGGIQFMLVGFVTAVVVLIVCYAVSEALALVLPGAKPATSPSRPAFERQVKSRFG